MSQSGAYELRVGNARLHERTRMHTLTLPGARAHTQIYNIYCLFTETMICESASMLRYTHIVLFRFSQRFSSGILQGYNSALLDKQFLKVTL